MHINKTITIVSDISIQDLVANDRNIELDNRQAFFANDSTYEKENEYDLGALNETSQFNKSTYALDLVYKKNFCLFFSITL